MPEPLYTMDIKRRLALAVSRGDRQSMLINEMLVGSVDITNGSFNPRTPWYRVGRTQLAWSSYMALRKRLIAVGFVFEQENFNGYRKDNVYGRIKMIFPEELNGTHPN